MTTYVAKAVQYELMTGQEWQYGVYFRDRWQVTKDLTLNLVLRYEAYPMMTRADRGIEFYDETTNKVILVGKAGNPRKSGQGKHPNFLPRSRGWSIAEDNVLRGGTG